MRYFIFINVFNLAATGHGDRLPDFDAPSIAGLENGATGALINVLVLFPALVSSAFGQ